MKAYSVRDSDYDIEAILMFTIPHQNGDVLCIWMFDDGSTTCMPWPESDLLKDHNYIRLL